MSERQFKEPPDRLYGRRSGHRLRARQRLLLAEILPRLRFAPDDARDPAGAFAPRAGEVWLEVGFGAGEHALATIGAHAGIGLIACEVFENGVASLLSTLVPEGEEASSLLPGNLRLWTDDARVLIRALPHASVGRLFLLFPDPWPKARHAKRRFLHPLFLPEIARILSPGAEWRIATDDPVLQGWTAEVLARQEFFRVSLPLARRPVG
ncbi:MAG TPA: tRNA (guanine-N7)-methyltransferase, partial [Acetobacteraceae bacterium]|nr:tRNA (guanine-N7)-methyltransferase [Acetobacteraceae bacterium]